MYRLAIGGAGFALRNNIERDAAEAEKLSLQLVVIGGAAFSDRWMHIIADIAGH